MVKYSYGLAIVKKYIFVLLLAMVKQLYWFDNSYGLAMASHDLAIQKCFKISVAV